MEKGGSRRSGFSISDNKSPPNSDDGNSLKKLHSAEVFPSKIRLMGIHNMDRRFDGGGGGGGGPTDGSNSGGANEVVGHMLYYDNVSSPRLAAENFSTTNSQQPFDIFASLYSTTHKSPERTMAASGAFPFTSAQWKELERQAMIYKYMMSSLPVPPHLLFPLSRNFPASPLDSSLSSIYNVRYSKNGDPEPGRCKRTDGKKWRCSRDVAPHQKYCERHLHRGRPRSRKPVELINNHSQNSNKKTRLDQTSLPHSTASQQLHFDPKTDLDISSAPCYRDLSLMDGTEKQWQSWAQSNMRFANEGCSIYSSSSLTHQDYVEENPLNMLSYSNFPAVNIEAPTCFINAYSSNNVSVDSTKPENLFPSLNLSIAMASGSLSDQETARVNCCDEQSLKDSRWLGQVSGEPFGRGGPLAEALGCKNRASTHNSISPVTTTVSSPTGVLHRTLFSHSDASSVCNSPTFAAPSSEVAFRWLN